MSFLSKLESAEHTFASWVAKEWKKLYAVEPEAEQIADTVLKYAGPALQFVVSAEAGGAAGAVVGAAVAEARSDLAAASGLLYDFGASPTVRSILDAVVNNLSALLTAGHIKSDGSKGIVSKIIRELQALVAAFAPEPTATN